MISEGQSIPPNWFEIKLGDIIELSYGKGLPKDNRNTYGKFPVYGSNGIVGYHDQSLIEGPAIIVGRKGAAGIPTYAKEDCWPIDTTYFIQPKPVYDLHFIYYLIRFLRLDRFDRSTAIPGLNRDDAYALKVALPPVNEQKRIVAKIEELFSELDNGIKSLKTARKQLKIYRQAILKHAFEGKFTDAWREQNNHRLESVDYILESISCERKVRYEHQLKDWKIQTQELGQSKKIIRPKSLKILNPISKTELQDLPKLPSSWKWIRLGDALETDVGFAFKSNEFSSNGIPLLRGENIEPGKLRWVDTKYWPNEKVQDYKNLLVRTGEIIIAMDRPVISSGLKVAVTKESDVPCLLVQRVCRIKKNNYFDTGYLYRAVDNMRFVKHCLGNQTGTQLPHISEGQIQNFPIPFCHPVEQMAIFERLQTKLSVCEAMESEIDIQLKKSEALRQSVLKKAFSGKLVAQNPNDEPASVLLEHINSEKEVQLRKKQKRSTA